MGNRAPGTLLRLVSKQESSHNFADNIEFKPCLVPQFAIILSLQMPVYERRVHLGSFEVKTIIFHLLCGSYHLRFIFIGTPDAKMQVSILQ